MRCRSAITQQGFDGQVLRHFGLPHDGEPDLSRWRSIVQTVRQPEGEVTIAVVGKYTSLLDSYKSLAEALTHGGIANNVRVKLDWIDAEIFESDDAVQHLEDVHGILVPGGFGERGVGRQDRGGALRARAQGAVFRHLLRHADGGDRGGAAIWPTAQRRLDRVRPVRRSRSSA